MGYKTEQEEFWAGEFGTDYIQRNTGPELLASNLGFFCKALARAARPASCIEFGANIGMNLRALKLLYPSLEQHAIEINATAAKELATFLPPANVHPASILDFKPARTWDLVLIKGVLIHMNPDSLPAVYEQSANVSIRGPGSRNSPGRSTGGFEKPNTPSDGMPSATARVASFWSTSVGNT